MQVKSTNPSDYDLAPVSIAAMPKEFPPGFNVLTHSHSKSQLIYAIRGVMEVSTDTGLWLVPPQRALWMPAGVSHRMRARGDVSLRTLYIRPHPGDVWAAGDPVSVAISGLLRELILRAIEIPLSRAPTDYECRILEMIPDEIRRERDDYLHLRQPEDPRLKIVCNGLIADPGDARELSDWGQLAGASPRTLARLFQKEFGLTFLGWRRQLRAFSAVPRLMAGEAITNIAADLGYETPGAFAAMFREIMGAPPSRYIASMRRRESCEEDESGPERMSV